MIRRILIVERRSSFNRDLNEGTKWSVKIYKWQVLGLTIWKTETLL